MANRGALVLVVVLALVGGCSGDSADDTTASSTMATTVAPTTAPTTTATTVAPTTVAPTTVAPTTPPTEPVVAVWPASDVVFTTPQAAAEDFLASVFGPGPVLGEFRAGDARSGEFDVFASVEGEPIGDPRSVLLMRQLGPADGWFVLAAVSDLATITEPAAYGTVPAGTLTVRGQGVGFEATIVVRAFVAGRADRDLDREVTMAGNFGEPAPYEVSLDLSAASAGEVVVILTQGGAGLETDPGDFAALPVVIGER